MKPLLTLSPLQLALGASIAVHAIVLSVHLADAQGFRRAFEDQPLEVILVNARSNERPDKARAVAQTSMAGGGDAERGRATSPLPPAPLSQAGDSSEEAFFHQLQAIQAVQNVLLMQRKQEVAALPLVDPQKVDLSPQQAEQEHKRRELVKELAEIEQRIKLDNMAPLKRYISPATQEVAYAVYYDQLRRSIEDKGTANFPEVAGRKLYGELTMRVEVNFDGRVLETRIVHSSGNRTLDRRAEAIVRSAAPFGDFSTAMRRDGDAIFFSPRFRFTRDETLEAGSK